MKRLFFYAALLVTAIGRADDQVSVIVNGTNYFCSSQGSGGQAVRLNPGKYQRSDGVFFSIRYIEYAGTSVSGFAYIFPDGGHANFTCQYVNCTWAGRELTIVDANNVIYEGRDYVRNGN